MSLLTSKLSDEDRKKAHELFGVPEQFDEVADLMVHEEEWQVILLMGKEPMTEKELRKLMEKNRLAASPYVLNQPHVLPQRTQQGHGCGRADLEDQRLLQPLFLLCAV